MNDNGNNTKHNNRM